MVSLTPAYYPVNDTSLSEGERAYLQQLQDYAETQDLSQDLRPQTRNLSIAFTVLATFVVGLRFLARHKQNAPYGIDDWLIVASIILLGGNLAFNLVMINEGLGLHSGLLTIDELMKLNQVGTLFGGKEKTVPFPGQKKTSATKYIIFKIPPSNTKLSLTDRRRSRSRLHNRRQPLQNLAPLPLLPHLSPPLDSQMGPRLRRRLDCVEPSLYLCRLVSMPPAHQDLGAVGFRLLH